MGRLRNIVIFSFFLVLILPVLSTAQKDILPDKRPDGTKLLEGFVYYTDAQRVSLKSEKIRFPLNLDEHQLGLEIINVLLQGPSRSDLEALWPSTVHLNAFFIADNGSAYVDLDLPLQINQTMDSRSEVLAIYSLVNSLTLNIPKIKRVKILVAGKDAKTLAGHVDIQYFYLTNMLIVK